MVLIQHHTHHRDREIYLPPPPPKLKNLRRKTHQMTTSLPYCLQRRDEQSIKGQSVYFGVTICNINIQLFTCCLIRFRHAQSHISNEHQLWFDNKQATHCPVNIYNSPVRQQTQYFLFPSIISCMWKPFNVSCGEGRGSLIRSSSLENWSETHLEQRSEVHKQPTTRDHVHLES